MPLWVDQLLEDPGLGLHLVAGRAGLRSRGPIRWVHASEIPDPTPWLEGGEVLLTTGLGVLGSEEAQRKLVAGLAARGCAGVGFGVGVCIDDVPPAMVEEAERLDLPLFTVPYEVPFIAVTKRISHHIFEEHYSTLGQAVDLHRRILAAVLGGQGFDAVLGAVGRALPGHSWVLFDYYGQALATWAPTGAVPADPAAVWEGIGGLLRDADRVEIDLPGPGAGRAGHHVVAAAVRLGEQVEAYLAMLGDRPLHDHEVLLLEQAMTGVSLELARGQSVREAHRVRVDDLLAEVATGRMAAQAVEDRLHRLGVDVATGYAVLCIDGGPRSQVRQRAFITTVEDALAAVTPPVIGRSDGSLYAVVPSGSGAAERVADAIRSRGWPDLVIGRSRVRYDTDGFLVALREAHVAAVTPAWGEERVRDIGLLGLQGLIAGMVDDLGADAFVDQTIGALLAHDRDEGGALVDTVRAYHRHGCRPGPAADELGIHRHTLAYRLDRVRDLTGADPRDGTHLLAFALALALHARGTDGT